MKMQILLKHTLISHIFINMTVKGPTAYNLIWNE